MLPVLAMNQKLDRLLQVAATQAEELREAKSANEDSQKQLKELTNKVASLEQQLAAKDTQPARIAKLPRTISNSIKHIHAAAEPDKQFKGDKL